MYKTKMVKVYLSNLPFLSFSLIINVLVLNIKTLPVRSQEATSQASIEQAANPTQAALEPEILSEINRVRTNPQEYAQWLETQRQYYDGIWLKLPGEKPIRTNKGLMALKEAIAVLKKQTPLSPLSKSEVTLSQANTKLEDFATANNIQYISYGRVTPEGIVMSLVVDELFPDRRRRDNLLSPDATNTGVVCKPDPRYAKVCAIAYSDSANPVDVAQDTTKPTDTSNGAQSEAIANQPQAPETNNTSASAPPADSSESETETVVSQSPATEVSNPSESEPSTAEVTPEAETEDTTVAQVLPQPPQPQVPSTPPGIPESTRSNSEAEESTPEEEVVLEEDDLEAEVVANSLEPETGDQTEVVAEPTPEAEVVVANPPEPEPDEKTEVIAEPTPEAEIVVANTPEPEPDEKTEVVATDPPELEIDDETEVIAEPTPEEDTEVDISASDSETVDIEAIAAEEAQVAVNSDNSLSLDDVQEGTLDDGDLVIPEDGSFYDSYPLEGKAGDSLTIYLESDEFDPFVALIDDQGNLIEQNDDISEEDSNSRIQVTIPDDGAYNVIVNAYDQDGKGKYILTVDR